MTRIFADFCWGSRDQRSNPQSAIRNPHSPKTLPFTSVVSVAFRVPLLTLLILSGCASSVRYAADSSTVKPVETRVESKSQPQPQPGPGPAPARARESFTGVASYYGPGFQGKKTASGERFDMHAMTAAHKTLPFGTMLRVTSLDNGKSVTVRVNDRGPFTRGRVLDLSKGAAQTIGMIQTGTAKVRCEVMD
jgi:rare lipoprotein A